MWGWKSFDTERPFLNKNGFGNVWSETALEANAVNMGRARVRALTDTALVKISF